MKALINLAMECLFNQGITEMLLQSLINYTEIQGGSSYK